MKVCHFEAQQLYRLDDRRLCIKHQATQSNKHFRVWFWVLIFPPYLSTVHSRKKKCIKNHIPVPQLPQARHSPSSSLSVGGRMIIQSVVLHASHQTQLPIANHNQLSIPFVHSSLPHYHLSILHPVHPTLSLLLHPTLRLLLQLIALMIGVLDGKAPDVEVIANSNNHINLHND